MSEKISVGPIGIGPRPNGFVSYVSHESSQYVRWHIDENGWAVGYSVLPLPYPFKKIRDMWNAK